MGEKRGDPGRLPPGRGLITSSHTKAREGTEGKQMTENDTTKKAVRDLISRGQATHAEAAKLAGKSRQLVRHWAQDLEPAREQLLKQQWEAALERASR